MAKHRENTDLRMFKEEWVRRVKFERCRCVSESDKKYYSHIGYSSNVQPQDINVDEQQESTPLLERKNLRRKDYQTSLVGIVNQIHNAESGASESISSGINVDKPVIREQQMCNNTSDNKRKDRKQSDLPIELRNVHGRRRIRSKSESNANDVSSEDISKYSKLLSSIPEIDNINKESE
ncbi:uncharacterized protein LOC134254923 [Saccostrea cucullata]|uniref:uncharacterized protein LOC134254923 n=1 Tax=Saccostrea cuccullata TaxID=36930 RepID=UPI002ED31ADF